MAKQQLADIVEGFKGVGRCGEGVAQGGVFLGQGHTGRRADHCAVVLGENDAGARFIGIAGQVGELVLAPPAIEVGIFLEDVEAQRRQRLRSAGIR